MKRMRAESSAPASRSRTRGWRTATGPMPVMIWRSGRCPVSQDAPAAVVGLQIGGRGQKLGHFRFDRLGQKRPRAIAQNLGQPVGQNPWLN